VSPEETTMPYATTLRRLASALALASVLLGSSALTGCVYSVEDDVDLTPTPDDDREYAAALAKSTQQRTVFKDFETRYTVTATYLSPEFRNAFTKRLERVYRKGEVYFAEADQKAGFFVSIHSPDADRTDLTNPQHWTVLLDSKDGPLKPILVKRINDKERWRAFFDSVTTWTTEYLVVFDAPAVNANSPELVAKTAIALTFANADAQVNLVW
jgi:hypothetical protein